MSLRSHHPALRHLRDERGFTLIELLVSMLAMTVVTMAAFSFSNSRQKTSRTSPRA